jgi:hypothetical protein
MKPCYVTGKGMFASEPTWSFKTTIIEMLETTRLGFDTRYRYYEKQFPGMEREPLARLICDPMEYYDQDWPKFRDQRSGTCSEDQAATEFMLQLDNRFRDEAEAVIACYNEAGFGSGVNAMYFLQAGKPLLGFYNRAQLAPSINLSNLLQLALAFPGLAEIHEYHNPEEIIETTRSWLENL